MTDRPPPSLPPSPPTSPPQREPQAVTDRYARRAAFAGPMDRYNILLPQVWQTLQERQRAQLRLFARLGWFDFSQRTWLEVGCGTGGNLLDVLRLGLAPDNVTGLELLPERIAQARASLPVAVRLIEGDALQAPLPADSFDVVQAFTVFSSLLDGAFQQRLAQHMWRWVKPGGGVLWYDFVVNNPRNADVRGVPLQRVHALFPQGVLQSQRVTLAPPLARRVCGVHPALYGVFNSLPWLRTHRLIWIAKPTSTA
jgi:SAM-dependent methyltransferase